MIHVSDVAHLGGHRLALTFDDGTSGEADLREHLRGPIFEPLADPKLFAGAYVDGGTVVWPNGADFAPETLYALAHGLPIPDSFEAVDQNELARDIEAGVRMNIP